MDDNTIYQIIFQSARTMVSLIMLGGVVALLANNTSGAIEQTLENLENATQIFQSMAG